MSGRKGRPAVTGMCEQAILEVIRDGPFVGSVEELSARICWSIPSTWRALAGVIARGLASHLGNGESLHLRITAAGRYARPRTRAGKMRRNVA